VNDQRPKWKSKRYPLDVFVISGHMHSGAGSSWKLMGLLGRHPAVKSYGMASYHDRAGYEQQAMKHMREGKVNTLFVNPGNLDNQWFDIAPFSDAVRSQHPNVVIVLYTWDDCRERVIKKHPKFSHYLFLHEFGDDTHDMSEADRSKIFSIDDLGYLYNNKAAARHLDAVLRKCEYWHETRYEYDVALSFAGEDRPHAEEVAIQLRGEGARVFYDQFEQANLLGSNLFETLYNVYSKRCRYTVMFVSKSYEEKLWTSHERRAAQERAFKERGSDFILPVRVDDTEVTALPQTIGYVRLDEGIEKVVDLIANKLWMVNPKHPKAHIGFRLY
jgi:hypothetical protein